MARSRVCGERACRSVGSSDCDFRFKGIAIFETTCPVADDAILTRPSVPAEYRSWPC